MGVLDDAIREHLELKRKHGAPEQEVEQQAQEVLGRTRRPPTEPASDVEQAPEPAAYPAGEPEAAHEAPAVQEPAPEEPVEQSEAEAPVAEEPTIPEAIDEPEIEPEPTPEDPRADTPPRGFEPVEEPEREDDEDVLEETPDFLQETPEHDRLWFEQKPPRDFDFDE